MVKKIPGFKVRDVGEHGVVSVERLVLIVKVLFCVFCLCKVFFSLQSEGNSSFLRAARAGNLEKVLAYLRENIDINTSNAVSATMTSLPPVTRPIT